MKGLRKIIAAALAVMLVSSVSAAALAANEKYGSAALEKNKNYTLEQMLTYAIQDEYVAQAEYKKIIASYGEERPFTNIVKAEAKHIAELTPLFEKYGFSLPANKGDEIAVLPESLLAANKTGITAEINNIAMYETFLAQDLPDDVRAVFTALRDASKNHLAAFERGVARLEGGTGRGRRGR